MGICILCTTYIQYTTWTWACFHLSRQLQLWETSVARGDFEQTQYCSGRLRQLVLICHLYENTMPRITRENAEKTTLVNKVKWMSDDGVGECACSGSIFASSRHGKLKYSIFDLTMYFIYSLADSVVIRLSRILWVGRFYDQAAITQGIICGATSASSELVALPPTCYLYFHTWSDTFSPQIPELTFRGI